MKRDKKIAAQVQRVYIASLSSTTMTHFRLFPRLFQRDRDILIETKPSSTKEGMYDHRIFACSRRGIPKTNPKSPDGTICTMRNMSHDGALTMFGYTIVRGDSSPRIYDTPPFQAVDAVGVRYEVLVRAVADKREAMSPLSDSD